MGRPVPLESDRPFFSRARTKKALLDLTWEVNTSSRLLIYGGAGVTIDRSNLDWRGMVDGLLSPYVESEQARDDIFRANSVLEVASLAMEYWKKDYGPDHYRGRIADRLRVMLYAPGDWQAGILATSLARLCAALAMKNHGFVLATPNYDDYLVEELQQHIPSPRIVTPTEDDSDPLTDRRPRRASWATSRSKLDEVVELFETRDTVLQLHGLIPRNETVNEGRVLSPVVGELDYIATEEYTRAALQQLLLVAPALFVGTSITDRPLLEALAKTKESGFQRFALVPVGFHLEHDRERHRALRASQLERYQHFGVTPIYVDYYFQIAQFIEEMVISVQQEVPEDFRPDEEAPELSSEAMSESISIAEHENDANQVPAGTYGSRLLQWASDWTALQADDTVSMALTEFAQQEVRSSLDLSDSEITKLELWVRDVPATHRHLRLWQSTVTLHLQEESARRAEFSNHSEVVAVRAFVAGRPITSQLGDEDLPYQRWRTYIGAPIRLADPLGRYGHLPVGALVFASMRPPSKSGLIKLRRRASMAQVMEVLRWLGELLTETEPRQQGLLRT